VAAQRGHSTPEAPHTTAAGHRPQGHGATSTKTKPRACPTWTPAPSTYARTLRHLQASDAQWRAEKNRAQPHTLGTPQAAGSGRLSRGPQALWRRSPPPPQPGLREYGRAAGTPLRERFAHGERAAATHRQHGLDAQALRRLPPPPPPPRRPRPRGKTPPRAANRRRRVWAWEYQLQLLSTAGQQKEGSVVKMHARHRCLFALSVGLAPLRLGSSASCCAHSRRGWRPEIQTGSPYTRKNVSMKQGVEGGG
jgi:hypothetical protein